jgi:hypothetical protein
VVVVDLCPPLLGQELVEERSDLLLLRKGKVSNLVDQEVKLSLLALQQGDSTAARQLLERRVELVKDSGNAALIEKARQDLAELDRKMKAGG